MAVPLLCSSQWAAAAGAVAAVAAAAVKPRASGEDHGLLICGSVVYFSSASHKASSMVGNVHAVQRMCCESIVAVQVQGYRALGTGLSQQLKRLQLCSKDTRTRVWGFKYVLPREPGFLQLPRH